MKTSTRWLVALLIATLPLSAHAHRLWMLPSSTVLGEDQWITVDAAVSNDLFFFNYVPLRLDGLEVTAPDGARAEPHNAHTGKYRSVFDLHLETPGTYRLAIVNSGLMASWSEAGETRRWRGSAAELEANVPADASELRVTQRAGRVETFVTAGAPTDTVLEPVNQGLELVPLTHPNDLFVEETVRWRFLIDGQPAAGLPIEMVPGGIRYRDEQQAITLTTDAQGGVEFTFPTPGMWGVEASLRDDRASIPQAAERQASYAATFEVLPQ